MKRVLIALCIILMPGFIFSDMVYGQGSTVIQGKIVDASGEPVVGANIYIKGTTVGTVSDLRGNFSLRTQMSGDQTIVI